MDTTESSAEVRAFYERHPYPGPVTDLSGYRDWWEQGERRRTRRWQTSVSCLMGTRSPIWSTRQGISGVLRHWRMHCLIRRIVHIRCHKSTIGSSKENAREFIEQLWRDDQIVFDASRR